jgi:hypothetical protein
VDMAHGEMAEKQLDALIERRSRKGEVDRDENGELWNASVRRYTTRRREEMRVACASYHAGQVARHRRTLQGLIAHHKAQAVRLRED